jgi:hypothetical protein
MKRVWQLSLVLGLLMGLHGMALACGNHTQSASTVDTAEQQTPTADEGHTCGADCACNHAQDAQNADPTTTSTEGQEAEAATCPHHQQQEAAEDGSTTAATTGEETGQACGCQHGQAEADGAELTN